MQVYVYTLYGSRTAFSAAKDLGLGQSDSPFVRHTGKDLHNYHIYARQRIDVNP